jgi:hypothetical protein
LLLIFGVYNSFSQKIVGAAFFMKGGYTHVQGSAKILNSVAPQGISCFSDNNYIIGSDGYFRANKIILGLDGYLATRESKTSKFVTNGISKGADAYSGTAHAKLGIIVNQGKKYWVYPSLGAGIAVIGMNTFDKKASFARLNEHNIISYSPSFDIGLNTDIILSPENKNDIFGAMLLGFRVGYHNSIFKNNWRDKDWNHLENLPSYTNRGFYVTINIGAGAFFRKKY